MARLVSPKQVVDLSTKINLHWYLSRMRPSFYCKKFQRQRRKKKELKAKSNMSTDGGGLLVATMAARRMMKEREDQIKERGRVVYAMYLLKKWPLNGRLKVIVLVRKFSFPRGVSSHVFFLHN